MLHGPYISVFIEKDAAAADRSVGLSALPLQSKIRGDILQADRSHSLVRKPVEHIFAVFILCPYLQFVPNGIVLVDPAVAVLIILCQICKTIAACRSKKFTSVVDDAVAVLIQGKIPAARAQL